jgi:hypothetical protein
LVGCSIRSSVSPHDEILQNLLTSKTSLRAWDSVTTLFFKEFELENREFFKRGLLVGSMKRVEGFKFKSFFVFKNLVFDFFRDVASIHDDATR